MKIQIQNIWTMQFVVLSLLSALFYVAAFESLEYDHFSHFEFRNSEKMEAIQEAMRSIQAPTSEVVPVVNANQGSAVSYFVIGLYGFYLNNEQHPLDCSSSFGPSSPPIGEYYPLNLCYISKKGGSYMYSAMTDGLNNTMYISSYTDYTCSGIASTKVYVSGFSSCSNLTFIRSNFPYTTSIISASALPGGIVSQGFPCSDPTCTSYDCTQTADFNYITRTGVCVNSNTSSVTAACNTEYVTYYGWHQNSCPGKSVLGVVLGMTQPASACPSTGHVHTCTTIDTEISSSSSSSSSDGLSSGGTAGVVIGVLVGIVLIGGLGYYFGHATGKRAGALSKSEMLL